MSDAPVGIFLSHASENKKQVQDLNRRLKAAGYRTWLDEDQLLPGDKWNLEIQKALEQADLMIVFLSQFANQKSGYCQKEIEWALERQKEMPEGGIFLIPARLDNCDYPSRLKDIQGVDLFKNNGWDKLLKTLRKLPEDQRRRVLAGPKPTTAGAPFRVLLLSTEKDLAEWRECTANYLRDILGVEIAKENDSTTSIDLTVLLCSSGKKSPDGLWLR